MSRGKTISKRVIQPDPLYKSGLLAKFINYLMERGKKSVAQTIVYQALEMIKKKKNQEPLKLFEQAIEALRPQLEVRSRRVGGANYQIPLPVSVGRQNYLACTWLIQAARTRKGQTMVDRLVAELLDVTDGTGAALKKKEDVHRMAEANKAFAHFARFSR